jgi:sugar/nucleoside kinase (ribokinase family)
MPQVVCFGNPVYDLISTPTIQPSNRVLSGCSTNASLAFSKLGVNSFLVGNIGDDFSSKLKEDLDSREIGYELHRSEQTGGFKLVYYDDQGNRHLSVLGVAGDIQFINPLPVLKDASFVLLGPILGELSIDFGYQLRKSTSAPIFLDPQGTLRKIKDEKVIHEITDNFRELARISKIVKANELETETATGLAPRSNPRKAVEALHRYGAGISIVTLAEAGSVIFDGENYIEIPPFITNAIDPTGAGDTYAAGFIYRYLNDPSDLFSAGCFGSVVASVMVENTGPDFPLTLDEAQRRMEILITSKRGLKL